MISTQDLLNIVLIIVSIVFIGTFIYVSIIFVATLKAVRKITEMLSDTTKDIAVLKDSLKVGALGIAGKILGIVRGRR